MKAFLLADSRWERGIMDVAPVSRIAGALLFRPIPHRDERGFFCRTFDADAMRAAGLDPVAFVQHSLSRSARGVVRGLHVRRGSGEAKLVRCSCGAIFDVIVDLRPASPTYRNWESFQLRDDEQVTLYVPAGCVHGLQALTDPADVSYQIDAASSSGPGRNAGLSRRPGSSQGSLAFTDPGRPMIDTIDFQETLETITSQHKRQIREGSPGPETTEATGSPENSGVIY